MRLWITAIALVATRVYDWAMSKLYIKVSGLKIEVIVLEKRAIFGRSEVKITPVSGECEKWVNKDKLIRKK